MMCTDFDRINFFDSSLKILGEAVSNGYESFYTSCMSVHKEMQVMYPEIPSLTDYGR